MTDVQKIAFDTLKAGAPGLSDQTREVLAGIIARKVALSTTPARAEAQDEGAAGEIARLMSLAAAADADGEPDQAMRLVQQADALRTAHPSPTPAADADRVRIAVDPEDMRVIGDWINEGEPSSSVPSGRIKALWQAVRAALKSTAAKEGGE